MKRRNILLAALVAVAFLTGFVWLIFRSHAPPEPVYKGKRLSEWLHEREVDATEEAVRQIGTNAIPTLLQMLRAHDSKLKLKLIQVAQKQQLIKISFVEAGQRNWEAMRAFEILGADASNAVPALIHIYQEGISEDSQKDAATAIGFIGPAAKAAVPELLRAVADTNALAAARGSAALSLVAIHHNLDLVVPALIKCLKDSHVRAIAAYALGLLGSDAKAAVPALLDLLKDPVIGVRQRAEEALKAIDPEAAAKAGVK